MLDGGGMGLGQGGHMRMKYGDMTCDGETRDLHAHLNTY